MATDVIDFVAQASGPLLIAVTFALVFAESAILLDLFVPGEVGLVVAGAAAAQNETPIWAIVLAAGLGAMAGDSLGFWLGRGVGQNAVRRWRWSRRWLEPRTRRAKEHFERRGGWSVAIARWIGALRAVVPLVAGTAGRSYGWFVAWDAPSALLWSATVATAGYVFGDDVARIVDKIGFGISVLAVLAVIVYVVIRRRRRGDREESGNVRVRSSAPGDAAPEGGEAEGHAHRTHADDRRQRSADGGPVPALVERSEPGE